MGNQVCTSVDKDGHRTISILTKEHLNERDNMMKERAAKDKEDFYQPGEDTMNPSKCCEALLIQGTAHEDKFHHKLMGVYRLYKPMSWIEYTKKDRPHHPDLQGKYPVYLHNFANFTPSSERLHPQTSYLYYYLNTAKDQPENDICKVRGCWMIGVYYPFLVLTSHMLCCLEANLLFSGLQALTIRPRTAIGLAGSTTSPGPARHQSVRRA